MVRHVDVISVEEFVEAEEFTHDTVCANGEILFENVCWYRPRPLQARSHEWVSPMTVALRDLDQEQLRGGSRDGAGRAEGARASRPASRTWSGIARTTARWSSARSAPGRRAGGPST